MDMGNNKRRNVLTYAGVNFSQSETSLLLRGRGGGRGRELNFELLLGGGGGELAEQITDPFFVRKTFSDYIITKLLDSTHVNFSRSEHFIHTRFNFYV